MELAKITTGVSCYAPKGVSARPQPSTIHVGARMSQLPFMTEAVRREFPPGKVRELTPLVRRITGTNAGMMTGPGTNTYLVGTQRIAVIDPGIDDAAHLEAVAAAGDGRIEWIIVTHKHPDHAPGSRRLQALTGAPVLAHPTPLEGVHDRDFAADEWLHDGDTVATDEFTLRVMHTPGHAADHLCLLLEEERILLAGDQVMDGATVVIAPPDGDMRAYLQSLERLRRLDLDALAPGHGRLLKDPRSVLDEIIDHRQEREHMVLNAVIEQRLSDVPAMVAHIYTDVPEALHPVARGTVLAHLYKLQAEGLVEQHEAHWRAGSQPKRSAHP